MAIIRDRALLNEDGSIPEKLILNCIKEHQDMIPRYEQLEDYYNGKHSILERQMRGIGLPNNKLVCNHAEYITDMATGYFIGNPVIYTSDKIEPILENFKQNNIQLVDTELCRDISKFGVGYELVYMTTNEVPVPKSTNINPKNMFIVVDDTVEYKTIFACHYYAKKDLDNKIIGYVIKIYTDTMVFHYFTKTLKDNPILQNIEVHYFKQVPVIEYWNKSNMQGDYEGVISLIDAYNTLTSDRINDKQQLVDALLVITGASFGDTEDAVSETARKVREMKLLELPTDNAKAEWLTKQLNEADTEVLKKSLQQDIQKFSKVPDLTDEAFGGNQSGVAIKYKLLGLEQLAKTKEGYYIISLKERLQLYANIYSTKGHSLDIADVRITFARSLPVNEPEIINSVVALEGVVSDETRLALLPFIDDVKAELDKLKEQKKENMKEFSNSMGNYTFGAENEDNLDNEDDLDETREVLEE